MLGKKRITIRNTDKNFQIIMIPLSKEEFKEFEKDYESISGDELYRQTDINKFIDKYSIKPEEVYLYGDTTLSNIDKSNKDTYEYFANLLTYVVGEPVNRYHPVKKINYNSYPCFCENRFNIEAFTDHPNAYESWKCLMAKYLYPEYCLIINRKLIGTKINAGTRNETSS